MTQIISLSEMRDVDIKTVDRVTLVDIRDTKINSALSITDRVIDFIHQIKNPYCYKCGNTVVKIKFADTDVSMEERMKGYFRSL